MFIKKKASSSPTFEQTVPNRKLKAKDLHKYVWGLLGILALFWASFPVAYWRVSQSERFEDRPFRSLSWAGNQKDNLAYPEKK